MIQCRRAYSAKKSHQLSAGSMLNCFVGKHTTSKGASFQYRCTGLHALRSYDDTFFSKCQTKYPLSSGFLSNARCHQPINVVRATTMRTYENVTVDRSGHQSNCVKGEDAISPYFRGTSVRSSSPFSSSRIPSHPIQIGNQPWYGDFPININTPSSQLTNFKLNYYNRQSSRSYVFFPSSISEMTKSLKEAIDNVKRKHTRRTKNNTQHFIRRIRKSRQKMFTRLHIDRNSRIKQYDRMEKSSRKQYKKTKSRFVRWKRLQEENFMVKRAVMKRSSQVFFKRFRSKSREYRENLMLHLPHNLQMMDKRFQKYKKRRSLITYGSKLFPLSRHAITITEPFQKEWFSIDGYPLTTKDPRTGRFVNPWNSETTNGWKTVKEIWNWKKKKYFGLDYDREHHDNHRKENYTDVLDGFKDYLHPAPHEKIITSPSTPDRLKLTWIGHATSLLQVSDIFTILIDPVFSHKASPLQILPNTEFIGPPRRQPPSILLEDGKLTPDGGNVDVCLISHDHYDHLDLASVDELVRGEKVQFWVVPMGLKRWLLEVGVPDRMITELEWWESVKLTKNTLDGCLEMVVVAPSKANGQTVSDRGDRTMTPYSMGKKDAYNEMIITCAPSQHWCGRNPFDRNQRLWCSWAVHATVTAAAAPSSTTYNGKSSESRQKLSFYFAGDTGYPKTFPLHRQIGDRLGPFDLAAIPIGAYEPRFFMRDSHCDPYEAVQIHKDIRAKTSVAIHWGTFPLADEPFEEPPRVLYDAVRKFKAKLREEHRFKNEDWVNSKADFVAIPHGSYIESKGTN